VGERYGFCSRQLWCRVALAEIGALQQSFGCGNDPTGWVGGTPGKCLGLKRNVDLFSGLSEEDPNVDPKSIGGCWEFYKNESTVHRTE
jgi:hypothetical protein